MNKYFFSLVLIIFCFVLGTTPGFAVNPDLIVSNIRLLSDCNVEFTFKNIGNGSVPDSGFTAASVQFYKNNGPWGGFSISAIDPNKVLKNPGGQVTYKFYNKLGGGTHTVSAHIDVTNKITESNDNNNRLNKSLTCTSMPQDIGPDFAIVNIFQESDCKFSFVMQNKGTQPIPEHEYKRASGMLIKVRKDGKVYQNVWLIDADPQKKTQQPGGYKKYIFPGQSNPKPGQVKYHILGQGQIVGWDADLSNNWKEKILNCRFSDLIVEKHFTNPSTVLVGKDTKFLAKVKNIGNKKSGPCWLQIKLGGESNPPDLYVPALDPGQSVNVSRIDKFNTTGSYSFRSYVDYKRNVHELDENNNKKTTSIKVKKPSLPDLYVDKIYTVPAIPKKGQAFNVFAILKKKGASPILRKVEYSFKVGGETRPKTGKVDFIMRTTVKIGRKVILNRSGNFRVTVKVDPNNRIGESRETNNTKTYNIKIQ